MLKIHILTDDRVRKRSILAEHGLSLFIEKDNKKILFDTGQSDVFLKNARKMDLDIKDTDYTIISHGHYDHLGGLLKLLKQSTTKIYIHPHALFEKYKCVTKDGPFVEIGIPFDSTKVKNEQIIHTVKPYSIDKDITVSGYIPGFCDYENPDDIFYKKENGRLTYDKLEDEQLLIIEDSKEIAVFLGCSHPGVINGIKYVKKLMPGKNIKLVIGGMHLENVKAERLSKTIRFLRESNIKRIAPLHCTGMKAMYELKKALGKRCLLLSAGDTLDI